ncbi:MAG: glycosyltransferase [Hydrogenophaga sp.]|jgi:cellulose synthase (UDP-forming)|nr:glycosyltransferase [Hydrogenophaga sp.]
MSPRLILSLWRERWGKAGDSAPKRPYLEGVINQWGDRLMAAQVWSLPGILKLTVLLCALGLAFVATVDLSLKSQMVFAGLVVAISLYTRRYGGAWVTLILVGLSLVASARYLFWRFDATLSPHLDMALVLGFALCAAELHLVLLRMVDLLAGAYPVKRAPVPLPADPGDWPTVDVFIPCQGLTAASIERAARAALALDWPPEKIKRYLLDDRPTDTTRLLAASMGLTYWPSPAGDASQTESLNQLLLVTQGEWIVVFDGDKAPDRHFLTSTAGWWVADRTLGMMQTATHFLVPEASQRSRSILGASDLGGSCVVLRRSMLLQAGGLAPEPVTEKSHTALKLQALGLRNAYIGFLPPQGQHLEHSPHASGPSQPAPPVLDVFRVDQPFSVGSLASKQGLASLQAMLQFYRVVPMLVFLMAPLAYLLANVNVIQTSTDLLLAFFVPHWLQGYIAHSRFEGKTRLTWLEDIKEAALGLCILVSTALSVTRTEWMRWLDVQQRDKLPLQEAFDGLTVWPFALVLTLNLAGFMSGLAQWIRPPHESTGMPTLYLLWAGYNLLLLAAMLAVAKESQHIRQQTRLQARRSASVRLPSGHAVSCVTENFPSNVLTLAVPVPMTLEEDTRVHISIFRQGREFVFPARVVSCQGHALCAHIEEAVQTSYRAVAAAVFSRGPDWPKWLPGRDADQPFPPWVLRAFDAVRTVMLGLKKRLAEWSWWLLLGGWMQAWKKR